MYAVSTNHIADILHYNDKTIYQPVMRPFWILFKMKMCIRVPQPKDWKRRHVRQNKNLEIGKQLTFILEIKLLKHIF